MDSVLFFKEILKSNLDKVGHKAMKVSELFNDKFNVPPGFVITTEAFDIFIEKNRIKDKIKSLLLKLNEGNVEKVSVQIKKMITDAEFPKPLEEEIIENYESLGFELNKLKISDLLSIKNSAIVSLRSSSVDDTNINPLVLLNEKGKNNVLVAIRRCWASMYNEDMLNYKLKNDVELKNAVLIQKMIDSESSGLAYSSNPETNSQDEILVKACFGYGNSINKICPDSYIVNKKDLSLKNSEVNEQEFSFTIDHARNVNIKKYLKDKAKSQKLNDRLITEVARIVKRVSGQLDKEIMIEWSMFKDNIYIFQYKDLDIEFEEEKMEEEKPIDVYEPSIEEDLEVLNEIESDNYASEKVDEEIKEEEEERKEGDVQDFINMVEEEKIEEENIPSIDEIEDVEEEKIQIPKINSDGFASHYDDVEEENKTTSFDMVKELTQKMESQLNEDDKEGYEQTREKLKRTLEGL